MVSLIRFLNFADDTKIVGKVGSNERIKVLLSYLHMMFEWSQVGKCYLIQTHNLGFNNKEAEYVLGKGFRGYSPHISSHVDRVLNLKQQLMQYRY